MALEVVVPDDAVLVISLDFDLSLFSLSIAVTSDGGSVLPSILQLSTPMEPCRQLRTPISFRPTSSRPVLYYTRTRTCTCTPGVLAVRHTLVHVAQSQCREVWPQCLRERKRHEERFSETQWQRETRKEKRSDSQISEET